jgi:hypothetical protein
MLQRVYGPLLIYDNSGLNNFNEVHTYQTLDITSIDDLKVLRDYKKVVLN